VGTLPGCDAAASRRKGLGPRAYVRLDIFRAMQRGTNILMYNVHLDPKGPFVHVVFLYACFRFSVSATAFGLGFLDTSHLSVIWHSFAHPYINHHRSPISMPPSNPSVGMHYIYILVRLFFVFGLCISIPSFHVLLIHASSPYAYPPRDALHTLSMFSTFFFRYSCFYRFFPLRYSCSFV